MAMTETGAGSRWHLPHNLSLAVAFCSAVHEKEESHLMNTEFHQQDDGMCVSTQHTANTCSNNKKSEKNAKRK